MGRNASPLFLMTILVLVFYIENSSALTRFNLALGRPAHQSDDDLSTEVSNSTAAAVVDGNTDQDFLNGSCSSIGPNVTPGLNWWAVEMEAPSTVRKMVIYNRVDCCTDDLADFDVHVTNRRPVPGSQFKVIPEELCYHHKGPAESVTTVEKCSAEIIGRFIVISQSRIRPLTLCEVQVFGIRLGNLALASSAFQIDKLDDKGYEKAGPESAVDGRKRNDFVKYKECAHTKSGLGNFTKNWWAVELVAPTRIYQVDILNRLLQAEKFANFSIYATNTAPTPGEDLPNLPSSALCYYNEGPATSGLTSYHCTKVVVGKYVIIAQSRERPLTLCEVFVMGTVQDNLALRRPTFQYDSDPTLDSIYTASSNAVDGSIARYLTRGTSCTLTNSGDDKYGQTNWWAVELERPALVKRLYVSNRADCCSENLDDYIIAVTNSKPGRRMIISRDEICYRKSGAASKKPEIVECTSELIGRYVVVMVSRKVPLSLCEVMVFGVLQPLQMVNLPFDAKYGIKELSGKFTTIAYSVSLGGGWYDKPNSAARFFKNKKSYLVIKMGGKFNLKGRFSLVLNIRPSSGDAPIMELVAEPFSVNVWLKKGNILTLNFYSSSQGASNRKEVDLSSGLAVAYNTWSLVGVTFDAVTGKVNFYVNGKTSEVTAKGNMFVPTKTGDVFIGGTCAKRPTFTGFDGKMASFRLFESLVTTQQMVAFKPKTGPAACPNGQVRKYTVSEHTGVVGGSMLYVMPSESHDPYFCLKRCMEESRCIALDLSVAGGCIFRDTVGQVTKMVWMTHYGMTCTKETDSLLPAPAGEEVTYVKFPGYTITGGGFEILPNATVESCQERCTARWNGYYTCTIFEYIAAAQMCRMNMITKDNIKAHSLQNKTGIDVYYRSSRMVSTSSRLVSTVCEGNNETLSCPAGTTLSISSASWGRSNGFVCSDGQSLVERLNLPTNCSSPDADGLVKGLCNGKIVCELSASSGTALGGDPCPGTEKFLSVSYTCQGSQSSSQIGQVGLAFTVITVLLIVALAIFGICYIFCWTRVLATIEMCRSCSCCPCCPRRNEHKEEGHHIELEGEIRMERASTSSSDSVKA